MQIGDKLSFGNNSWIVLDIQDDKALLLTEFIIEQESYHSSYSEITQADCTLRKYLNGEFYNSFPKSEQEKICSTKNVNADNQWYGTNGGADTEDKIFLLSMEEIVCKYFGEVLKNSTSPAKIKDTGLKEKISITAIELQDFKIIKNKSGGGGQDLRALSE